jgi:hypothetical protein
MKLYILALALLALFLLASPFLLGYGLFLLLNPVTFWQTTAWFIICLIVCGIEGFIAWIIGFAILASIF